MTGPESIAASITQIDEKKQNLKKAFDDLHAHRSLLSPSFNLSWSDIDSHFSSLQSSLFNRFRLLQSATPPPNPDKIETPTADTTEAPLLWPELRKFCEKNDGKGLGKYIIDHLKKRLSINQELPEAIRCSDDPAALVMDAIENSSYHCSSPSSSSSTRAIDVRRIFVLLLEALIEINANLTNDLRERARTLAYDWKSNIDNKPSEALGFMHLVAAYELGTLFSIEELCDYIFLISRYKQATTICRKIGLDRKRISELIHKFLDTGRSLVAIRFIYENEMTDEFKPVSILKSTLKNSREAAKRVCVEGNYSLKAQNEATDKELSALRAVIKVVKVRNLESDFVEERLEVCVKELEDQKAQRKRTIPKFTSPAYIQQQQQVDNKRPRVANGITTEYISTVPPPSQQPPLLPNPTSQSLQVNQYGLLSSILPGVAVPFGNPLGLLGSVPAPASRPVFYEQQSGYRVYGIRPQYQPPYYPQ